MAVVLRSVEINVCKVGFEKAREFWESSPHATAFTSPEVCRALGFEVEWWVAFKGDTPFVMWPVSRDHESSRLVRPPFSYYFGPMWSNHATNKSPTSSLSDAQACYGALLDELLGSYIGGGFDMNPLLRDVRVFDWWNYGESEESRFRISPRYTARLYDLQDLDAETLLAAMRKWRRIEVKRARQSGKFAMTTDVPISFFENVREETFLKQGATQDPAEAELIPRFQTLIDRGLAFTQGVVEIQTWQLVAANLTVDGQTESNLVLSVLRSSYRNQGVGPLATFEGILAAKERGRTIFDFNGANSPKRGDDKHSYGAVGELYFSVEVPDSRLSNASSSSQRLSGLIGLE